MTGIDRDDLDALAGEYVLGTLPAGERQRVEARLADEPGLARAVAGWQRRLAPLDAAVPPVEPPPELWRRIEARLGPGPAAATAAALERELQTAVERLRRRLAVWRGFGLTAAAVAAALALWLVAAPLPQPVQYVAVLNDEAGQPAWLVTVDLTRQEATIRPVEAEPLTDRAYELWLLPGPDQPPQSLGVLDASLPVEQALPAALTAGVPEGAALAVSLEPAGGSPTGLPTGPVVYSGPMLRQTL